MSNTQVTEKTINEQAPNPASNIEGIPIQVLYLHDTLKDSRRYACAKIVDLQDTFASLLMRLEQTLLPADKTPQALQRVIDETQAVLQKTSIRLNYRFYNLYSFCLDPKTFVACEIGQSIESALATLPSMEKLCVEWHNIHNFCFYGEEAVTQAMIANILDVGYQVAYKQGEGEIKLWTAEQGAFNQLHVQLDISVHSPRRGDKRWSNIAPQASFRLTLALCRKVMSASGGNLYLIPQAQGTHVVLSFPKIEHKK